MDTRTEKILRSTSCGPEIEQKILALAEDRITGEEEMMQLYSHMAGCDSCRYLFEDFFLLHNTVAETEDFEKIALKIKPEGIVPRSLSQQIPGQTAVLSRSPQKQIQFKARMGKEELLLRFIMGTRFINLEIESEQKGHRYYLIKDNDYDCVDTKGNTASFERLKEGSFILSDDLKNFIHIKLSS